MVEDTDSLSDREKTLRAAIAAKLYRLNQNGYTVVRVTDLADRVSANKRQRRNAEEHIEAMMNDGSVPLRQAIGGGAVELAARNDERTMHDWVAAYIAEMDQSGTVSIPTYDEE